MAQECVESLIIDGYTRESGVRNLERQIAAVCRKIAKEVVASEAKTPVSEFKRTVNAKLVEKFLGKKKFKHGVADSEDEIGLVNGLAYTSFGGSLLQVECAVIPGKGKLIITGQLGDVMQESARAALSYVRRRAEDLGLEQDFYQKLDIHMHFPEGAIPKDGPSAGVTMVTALVSALCGCLSAMMSP